VIYNFHKDTQLSFQGIKIKGGRRGEGRGLVLTKGDIATFTYENFSRFAIPINPKIYRIRDDVTWQQVIYNFHQNTQLSFQGTISCKNKRRGGEGERRATQSFQGTISYKIKGKEERMRGGGRG
jgi:hypothetical protein